jgi:CheY-like chemotaxis protein
MTRFDGLPDPRRGTIPEGGSLPPSGARLAGLRILLVEDDEDLSQLLQESFEKEGASVERTASTEAALAILRKRLPSLVVSDVELPDRSGYELIQELRSFPLGAGGDVPALAMTGHTRAEDKKRALAAGFDAHATKPIQLDALVRLVAEVAKKRPASAGA